MVSGTSARRYRLSIGVAVVLGLAFLFGPSSACFSADIPIATIAVGRNPAVIAVNPITHRVFVANYFSDSVSIIDGVSDVVTATVSTSYNGGLAIPISVVCNPLASPPRAYVANFWNSRITVIDETSGTALAHVASNGAHAGGPRALALDAANDKLYVAEYGGGSVTVFDALTYAQLKQITVGSSPRALGIFSSLPKTRIYVANRNSNTVSVIDGDTDTVVANLAVGAGPKAIAVDSSTGYAYVTCENANTVAVIDDSDVVTATIEVGQRPVGVAVDEVNGRVFVANFNSGTVSVLRTSDFSHEDTLTVGTQPWAVTFDSGDEKAFVTNYGSGNVSSIDNALSVTQVAAGTNPYAIAVNEGISPHKAYAGNWGSNNVTVIDEPASSGGSAVTGTFGAGGVSALDSPGSETPAVSVSIEPLAESPTFDTAPMVSGTATSSRTPYSAAIAGVFFRVDSEVAWRRAVITGGAGTPHATWSATLGPLDGGTHSLEVMAMDQTGVATAVSDGGTAVKSSSASGSETYSFTVLSTPVVASASAYNGVPGSSVTIQGSGFGGTQDSGWITFAGTSAQVVSWSDTAVTCVVPAGAQPGYVGVWQNGVCSNGLYFIPSAAPRVGSLSAGTAAYGEPISISGSGFGDSQGSGSVTFGGVTAVVTSWSDTSVTCLVPAGAQTGYVGVWQNGVCSNGLMFVPGGMPVIDTLSAGTAAAGRVIAVSGSGFGNSPGRLTLGGVPVEPNSWTDTEVTFAVPAGFAPGYVGVWKGTVCSNGRFFSPAPRIDSLSTSGGSPGTQVTITGVGFGSTQTDSRVTFAGTEASVLAWSDTSITCTVPGGGQPGYIGVWRYGVASNGAWFQVTSAP